MNTKTPDILLVVLALAECTSTTPQRDAEDMVAETTPDGWCCD